MCYYAKLQCREEFEEFITAQFYSELYMPVHDDEIFKKEVILYVFNIYSYQMFMLYL